jgi:N-acylglucosamine 2-epimerase
MSESLPAFTARPAECAALRAFYTRTLADNLLPWWLRQALDREAGGILTCIHDDGRIASHDKYVWSQVRAVWTFAAACNRVEDRPEWRQAARSLFEFALVHGQRPDGRWNFLLDRAGALKEGPESLQTDAFAICACVEYARLTGDERALRAARLTARAARNALARPGSYATKPYPIPPGTKAQRVSMQFSLAFFELAKLLRDPDLLAEGLRLTDDVLDHFRRPELRAAVEYLALDNSPLPPPIGAYSSPGHGIETAWFQIENLRGRPEPERLRKAAEIMRWAFERGWDPLHGGLLYSVALDGGASYLPHADAKIWWPHCEALCGALLAWEALGETWTLDAFLKTHNWSFAHFPDRRHGEWTQRLDRTGAQRLDSVVALPVKDPFHLPRALIYAIEALDRLAQRQFRKTP